MKKIKEHVIYYYNSYWLALISIAYGWQFDSPPKHFTNLSSLSENS